MKKLLMILSLVLFICILSGCRIKMGDDVLKCNELTGNCKFIEGKKSDDSGETTSGNQSGEDTKDDEIDPSAYNTNGELLVATALKYAGYLRNDFKPVAKKQGYTILDDTSWCAMFVSTIIKEAKITDLKKYTSASVSNFMYAMVKDNRFYHSKYWYNKSGKFKDPIGPQTGDIIFFTKESCAKEKYRGNGILPNKGDGCYRHIGIVVKATSSKITYVHGNTSGCKSFKGNGVCGNTTVSADSAYVIGYGR